MLATRTAPPHSTALCPGRLSHSHASKRVPYRCAATDEKNTSPVPAPDKAAPAGKVLREFDALGSKVIETTVQFEQGPEAVKDIWEDSKFETLGKVLENWFLPGIVVLALLTGGLAAKTYNDGAAPFVPPGAGEEQSVIVD